MVEKIFWNLLKKLIIQILYLSINSKIFITKRLFLLKKSLYIKFIYNIQLKLTVYLYSSWFA